MRDHTAVRTFQHLVALGAVSLGLLGCASNPAGDSPRDGAPTADHGTPHADRFAPLDLPPPSATRLVTGAPGPAYWQQRCDHDIAVRLDTEAHRVAATQTMVYTNNSPDALPCVWIQLEQNHFRLDSDGTILGGPSGRFGNRTRFDGGIEDLRVTDAHGGELAVDVVGTVGRVDLPEPVAAGGGTVTLNMEWAFAIPDYGDDRMGIEHAAGGDIYQIAQWFPTACVYDDVNGWNTRQYLGLGEFYSNFGDYTVAITVPADYLVAATGSLANEQDVLSPDELSRYSQAKSSFEPVVIVGKDEIGTHAAPVTASGMATWRFKAENVRTFVWAASKAFMWDACTIPAGHTVSDSPDRFVSSRPAVRSDVLVQSFYPIEAKATWTPESKDAEHADGSTDGGSTRMLRDSIIAYGSRWYTYPYPAASNVAGMVGGMEYPMIIFCSGRDEPRSLWSVTTHEIGHNWFPMIVNTNERLHAWMDEGFNSFINGYAGRDRYGDSRDDDDDGMSRRKRSMRTVSPRQFHQCVDTPPDLLEPGKLGLTQYARPAVALRFLRERVLGPERFDRAFRAYIERWAFKSPTPADFFRTMEDVSGVELDWFFRTWFYSTDAADLAVKAVNQPDDGAKTARVSFRNVGGMIMPVYYRVTYDDGSTEDRRIPVEAWAAGDVAADWWDTGVRRVRRVELDPDGETPDYNDRNDVWGR